MNQEIKGAWLFETSHTLAEFTAMADKRALGSTRDYPADRPHFVGVESFEAALRLAREGWADEMPAALAIAESVATDTRELTRDTFNPVWDVTGAEVDVARYLSGEPENMIDFPLAKTSREGRVITLAVGTAISGSVSASEYIKRGRGIVALAMALNTLGHAVEIWVFDSSACNGRSPGSAHQRVMVKSAHDEIDPAVLMFTLAHPAMHRALMWAARDKFPQPWRQGLSQKASRGLPHNTVAGIEREMYPEGTIFMPGIRAYDGVPDPEEWVRDQLRELELIAE